MLPCQYPARGASKWGRPASPRPAGLGIPPCGHRLLASGSDLLLEAVGSCFDFTCACARPAGRPPSGPSWPSVLPTLHSAFVLPPEKWITNLVLILGCLVDLWINVNAFQCIQLNRGPTLDSEPHECVSLPLDQSRARVLGGARPAGLGEATRPGFLSIFAQFWYTCSYNQNSSKTCGTH